MARLHPSAPSLDTLFDFAIPSHALAWEPIGDRVMGGLSTGRLLPLPGGIGAFSGELSVAQGGGFASVRSAAGRFDLSLHSGLLLEVRGDGRVYKLSLRTDPYFDGVSYQAAFATRAGRWEEVALPFESFRATWRGGPVPGAPRLDAGQVASFGLLLADRQPGPFRLEIHAIRALRIPAAPVGP